MRNLHLLCLAGLLAIGQGMSAIGAEVLRLDFENGANLAEDTSGNAVAGTVEQLNFFGSLTQSTDARPGSSGTGSASFAPVDFENGLYINFANADFPDFTPNDSFTVSLWMKPTSTFLADGNGFRGIVSGLSENAFTGADWQIDNGDTVEGGAGDGTTTLSRLNANVSFDLNSTDLVADQWQELTLTYHTLTRNVLFYIDGALTAATPNSTGLSMESLLVGTNRGSNRLYDGLIDDLLVLDTPVVIDDMGVARDAGDLDFDGDVDVDDWTEFRTGQGVDFSALSATAAYQLGDIDFDGDNDIDDFIDFKTLFDAANGPGALQAVIAGAIPEPGSASLVAIFGAVAAGLRRPRRGREQSNETPAASRKATKVMRTRNLSSLIVLGALALLGSRAAHSQTTVFSADFDSGLVADVGSFTFTNGVQSVVGIEGTSATTDWGTGALFADRGVDNNAANPGYVMDWEFTNPVALSGATIDFEFVTRRFNSNANRDHLVTGFDSNGTELFQIILFDRRDSGLTNIGDYVTSPETNERQRQTVGYDDPVTGATLFSTTQIATGAIPDSNDRSGGGNSFTAFFGADNADDANADVSDAGLFSLSLTSTGWSLVGTAAPAPNPGANAPLSDFTTNEVPFSNAGAIDLARIEVSGRTEQAGGFWDNLQVQGNIIAPPEPLKLQVFSNGDVKLVGGNPGGSSPASGIEIDAIQIFSEDVEQDGGSLNAAGFTGLAGAAGFPTGNGSGNGWEPGLANDDTFIAESFLLGSSVIGNNDEIGLGSGYVPGGSQDITFLYRVVGDDSATVGVVEYIQAEGLAGDYNGDDIVSAADYALARAATGATGVVADDIATWAANFGASLPSVSPAAQSVPEPASFGLLLVTGLSAALNCGARTRD